jgi:hypothetical protein
MRRSIWFWIGAAAMVAGATALASWLIRTARHEQPL